MKLAQFIQTNMEQLLQDWEEAALEIAPDMRGQSTLALRDHAQVMLGFICQDIDTSETSGESARKALGKNNAPAVDTGGQHGIHDENRDRFIFGSWSKN